jgi:lipopolysaccharide export system protein LptC
MTDYYYQAEDDDPAVADNRRPRFADQYPADSGFLPERYREVRREDEPYADDPAEASYPEDDYGAPADDGALANVASSDPDDWQADPYDADAGPGDDGGYDPPETGALPVAAAPPRRVTIAETGAASARRIRFDPTQERGPEHYTRAGRHSRLVRRLKFVLPAIAGLGVLGFLAFIQFAPGPDTAIIKLSGINVESKSVTMKKPHISGFEGTRRAYEVGAARAVQDLANPKVVTLDKINARLGIGDGDTAHIIATKGDYNGDTNKLVLTGGITLQTTNGYKASFEEAEIDIESGTMTSSRPLEIITGMASVKANAVEVRDEGKHVWFRNGVTVVYTPPDQPADGAAAATEPVDGAEPARTSEGGSS